jgi:hypothetical protein
VRGTASVKTPNDRHLFDAMLSFERQFDAYLLGVFPSVQLTAA